MTKFADMPSGSLKGWFLWCKSHDWCRNVQYVDGRLIVKTNDHTASFVNPRQLREWAGY